ncbi:alpha/beta fold hydrolase [Phenylobacterium immobile]|uniref:alpha/beta fold hydrolase n=1 Tax=Phenylobacterium immobile TaxID=21 RepID=UPI000A9E1564|nr:alpha/beta hydrolase [Phenylobacterium immobile]
MLFTRLAAPALLLGLCVLAPAASHAAEPSTPAAVFRETGRIVTDDGVNEQRLLKIGGIDQWVSVRGRHRTSPILLILHGGPGFTLSPLDFAYMRTWEEYFTVVQWDQRGAGKTRAANDPAVVTPPLTVKRMVDDAEELTAWLRSTYGKDRIAVMGHSFGTILGVELVQRRPEWFSAYVGMGQFVAFERNEALGYQQTLAAARAAGNVQAVAELESIAPFPDPRRPERNYEGLRIERRWLAEYDGYYWRRGTGTSDAVAAFSPNDTAADLAARRAGEGDSARQMWPELAMVDFTARNRFQAPVVFLQGRHDRGTSSTILAEWYETIQAPSKTLVWFEESAHMPFEEEPGKTLVSLVEKVLPLTR